MVAETLREGFVGGPGPLRSVGAVHDPGEGHRDLVVAVALSVDGRADVSVLRAEPYLYARWRPTGWHRERSRCWPLIQADRRGDLVGAAAAR